MISVVIVEDNPVDQAHIVNCLKHYEEEQGERFSIKVFSNPAVFLDSYQFGCDLIFMDIDMPLFNGIETARLLRETDSIVNLVFITNMEQYAIKGYEVDAVDFVVKPINYYRFSSMLRKVLRNLSHKTEKEVVLQSAGTLTRLRVSQIYYIEIQDHLLIYHTDQGRFESWGKLSDVEADLSEHDFVRCSPSHLVNLRHIISLDSSSINVAGTKLPLSQRRRKALLACVTEYLSKRA